MREKCRHAFVICAYGESKYLGACIRSLLGQTLPSRILMVTSTPCQYLYEQAQRYGIPFFIHEREDGIAGDWNFGYRKAKEYADYITIAHQDDIYHRSYTETMLRYVTGTSADAQPLVVFSNYAELRDNRITANNMLLLVKRIMLLPLLCRRNRSSVRIRRFIFSLGNPIMCPTILYCTENLPEKLFKPGFISNLDWEAWEELSSLKGSFIYEPRVLLLHRIHAESTTSFSIQRKIRKEEDQVMFRRFWPEQTARLLSRIYGMGERSN